MTKNAPIASDLKCLLWGLARQGERTFALAADVTEAQRQILVDPGYWRFPLCQVQAGGDVYVKTVGS